MPYHNPVKKKGIDVLFSKFCLDMQILPQGTPIFLADSDGRIVSKRKLPVCKDCFDSIFGLTDEKDIPFLSEQRKLKDAFAVKGRIDDGKNFIVVSAVGEGFSRCVVCSYSERDCIRLHDYIEKLCSYKDYIDSFRGLAFSEKANIPAKRLFKMRISGALELVELSSSADKDERKLSFPVVLALQKICAFAQKANGGNVNFDMGEVDESTIIKAPESFFRLTVSAIALVLRHSRNGRVGVCVKRVPETDFVRISFVTENRSGVHDLYGDVLVGAFLQRGFECGVMTDEKTYGIYFDAVLEKQVKPVLFDVAVMSEQIDSVVSEEIVSDLFFTLSDAQ